VQLWVPLTTAAVSPLTKPEKLTVKAGFGSPYTLVASATVTVNCAEVIVNVPGLLVTV